MIMQIDVAGERNKGREEVETIINSIINTFKKGRAIGDAKLDDFPTQNSAIDDGTEYRISLTIPFSYQIY